METIEVGRLCRLEREQVDKLVGKQRTLWSVNASSSGQQDTESDPQDTDSLDPLLPLETIHVEENSTAELTDCVDRKKVEVVQMLTMLTGRLGWRTGPSDCRPTGQLRWNTWESRPQNANHRSQGPAQWYDLKYKQQRSQINSIVPTQTPETWYKYCLGMNFK